MELMLLRVFQGQVEFQLKAILNAHERLIAAHQRGDMDEVWFSVENLLSAAANVSKALWGSGAAANVAREPLRDSVGVDDASPPFEKAHAESLRALRRATRAMVG
jgi:hypothetical protein